MEIGDSEKIVQVKTFRDLQGGSAMGKDINKNVMPLKDEKGNILGYGCLVDLYEIDRVENKLSFVRSIPAPINIKNFVRHIDKNDYELFL